MRGRPAPELFLRLGRAFYQLVPLRPGWRLVKRSRKSYQVHETPVGPTCDCADAVYRQRRCKHVEALKALGLIQ